METKRYLVEILYCFNHWLSDRNVRLIEENVLFVRDDAVKYEGEKRRVPREELVTAEQFPKAFKELLAGGPRWIHANAIPFGKNQYGKSRFLITLIAGEKIGAVRPSINVSYEPDKQAEMILTKTRATMK